MKARVTASMLRFAKQLKAVGVEPKIADAQAEATLEVIVGLLDENLATKQDFQLARQELMLVKSELLNPISESDYKITQNRISLEHAMTKLRDDLERKILEFKTDLERQISEVKTDLERQISETRKELKADISALDKRITKLEYEIAQLGYRLTIRLSIVCVSSITLAGTILGILFHFIK